ncbi:MAG: hypothetical protein ABIH92_01435 [Nanoarchaeota archaeon]
MKSRIDRVFEAYTDANGLTVKADFRNNGLLYVSPDGAELTRGQIEGSQGFAGFVDGFEGNPNRFKGPKGTRERKGEQTPLEQAFKEIVEMSSSNPHVKKLLDEIPILGKNEYQRQYTFGQASTDRPH